jgi:hypothetical protein
MQNGGLMMALMQTLATTERHRQQIKAAAPLLKEHIPSNPTV